MKRDWQNKKITGNGERMLSYTPCGEHASQLYKKKEVSQRYKLLSCSSRQVLQV